MTTTLEKMLAEPKTLIDLARSGEEVVLTDGGEPVIKMTGLGAAKVKFSPKKLNAWPDELAIHAAAASTAKNSGTTDGGDPAARPTPAVPGPRKASPGALRDWMQKAAAAAAAGATGKRGMTSDEIIDDLRSERC